MIKVKFSSYINSHSLTPDTGSKLHNMALHIRFCIFGTLYWSFPPSAFHNIHTARYQQTVQVPLSCMPGDWPPSRSVSRRNLSHKCHDGSSTRRWCFREVGRRAGVRWFSWGRLWWSGGFFWRWSACMVRCNYRNHGRRIGRFWCNCGIG